MKKIINIVVLIFFLAAAFCCHGAEKDEIDRRPDLGMFMWHRAGSIMATAEDKNEFLAAADAYYQIVQSGGRNSRVFYNLGTALLQAERHEEAKAWLRLAELYSGTSWEIRRNLLLAINKGTINADNAVPWYRIPLFWHFDLSMRVRGIIATLAFAMFWLALTLRRLSNGSHRAGVIAVLSLIALSAFGTSYVVSAHETREILENRTGNPMLLAPDPAPSREPGA